MITKHILEILGTLGSASTGIILTGCHKKASKKLNAKSPWLPNDLEEAGGYKKRGTIKTSKILHYMKKRGLVEKNSSKNGCVWTITPVGRERLRLMESRKHVGAPFVSSAKLKKGELKVIVFDIPESDRKKRDWLRLSLANLGFEMLQKSVWIGDVDLPDEFIVSLNNLQLLPKLHIFIVKEKGTIGLTI